MDSNCKCPACDEWVAVPAQINDFNCAWCGEPLHADRDISYSDGTVTDLTQLVSRRPHIERMILHGLDWIAENVSPP